MHGRVVNKEPMRLFAVLSQAFAVIARAARSPCSDTAPCLLRNRNSRPLARRQMQFRRRIDGSHIRCYTARADDRENAGSYKCIHRKNFFCEFLRSSSQSSSQRHIGHDVSWTLHLIEIRFVQPAEIEMIVIKIKSLVQPESRIEHRRRNDGSRLDIPTA